MYIVTLDRPYYPEVHYPTTEIEAQTLVRRLVAENKSEDGRHEAKVTMGMLVSQEFINTDY